MSQKALNSKLLKVAGNGSIKDIQSAIKNGADINAKDKYGNTALMLAAWSGCLTVDMLEAFLRNGACVNAKDRYGYTALMWAAYKGRLTADLLEIFLDNGAEINITKNSDAITIRNLLSCVNNSSPDIQEKFLLTMFNEKFSIQPLSPELIENIGSLLCSYLSFLEETGEDATEKLALVAKFLKKNCKKMIKKGTPETKKYLNQATAQIGVLIQHLDTEVTFNVNEMVI